MRRGLTVALVALALVALALPRAAAGQEPPPRSVQVEVSDVAGDRAYLSPGADGGMRPGAEVVVGSQRYRVIAVTGSHAVVALGEGRLEVGVTGTAEVRVTPEGAARGRPSPAPLESYQDAWPDAMPPAQGQAVEHVPLGGALGQAHRFVVHASSRGYAFIPIRGGRDAIGRGELRVRVRARPWSELPLRLDADTSVQLWLGDSLDDGPGAASRPTLRVRELQIAYGQQGDFYAALGRMRYAASTLGQLDGIRVEAPSVGPVTIAGFGGFVPDARSNAPAFNVGRFGVEATLRDLESELRPVVTVVGYGSIYDGELDERRLSAAAHFYPGESHIGGSLELTAFDADNPWGLDEVVVTAASLDATLRFEGFRVGARASWRLPERSKWLAALYPAAFLCTPVPNPSGPADRCLGWQDARLLGTADVGFEVDDYVVTGGATVVHTGDRGQLDQYGAFVAFRATRILGYGHLDLSAMISSGYFFETVAARAGFGAAVIPESLDVSLRYRPALSRYYADVDPFVEHLVGARMLLRPLPQLDVVLDADALFGRQIDAFLVQLSTAWHGAFL